MERGPGAIGRFLLRRLKRVKADPTLKPSTYRIMQPV